MSQGKLRASLGRGSGALLTQPRAYIIIPYDQAINLSKEHNHYIQVVKRQEVKDEVAWEDYADMSFRSSGKTASKRMVERVRDKLRSTVVVPASVEVDEFVAKRNHRDRGFASLKQKPPALKFWTPGSTQIMLWIGTAEQGRTARQHTQQTYKQKKKEKLAEKAKPSK